MPIDPQNTAQIRDRELRVWDLLLKRLERIDIARREGVHPAVISRIKKRVERRIIAETDQKAQSPQGAADRRDSARPARGMACVGGVV